MHAVSCAGPAAGFLCQESTRSTCCSLAGRGAVQLLSTVGGEVRNPCVNVDGRSLRITVGDQHHSGVKFTVLERFAEYWQKSIRREIQYPVKCWRDDDRRLFRAVVVHVDDQRGYGRRGGNGRTDQSSSRGPVRRLVRITVNNREAADG
jgi:hypothetical protein